MAKGLKHTGNWHWNGAEWEKNPASATAEVQAEILAALLNLTNMPEKTFTISPSGGDYTTIQAALDANAVAGALFLVYPGTYTNDTINFTAENQCVKGAGCSPKGVTIESATTISDFGAFTGCVVENVKMVMTLAINTIGTTVTGTGSANYKFCHCECVVTGTNSESGGASCYSGTGTVKVVEGSIVYNDTSDRTNSKGKKAVNIEAGSAWVIDDVTFTVTGSGTSSLMSAVRSTSTGTFTLDKCNIDIEDSGSLATYAFSVVNGNGSSEAKYNDVHVTNNVGTSAGAYLSSTGNVSFRSSYNHVHVYSSGGLAYTMILADSDVTAVSQFDDFISANGVDNTNGGTYTFVNSNSDGELDVSGNVAVGGVVDGVDIAAEETRLANTSGDNTGDQDLSSLATKANVLELDNTDVFTPNANYEPATKKYVDDNAGGGAVASVNGETGVVVLTTGDITEDTDKKFVSDTDKTNLGNLSGENTGDQTTIVGITGTKAEFDTAVTDGNITYDGDAPTAHKASHEDGGADEISIAGLLGTPAALSTHESDTTTHGTTGDIVGTTDTQTLTNKTFTAPVWDGWSNLIDEGTRVSAFVMTVTGDFTGSIQKGEKIKLTDTTTKYFNVESISYGGGVSTITFIANDDYSLVANPEDIFYSKIESPQGFPTQFTFSTVHGGYSTAPTGKLKFKVFGNRFICDYSDAAGGVSNSAATSFTVPVAPLSSISNLHPIQYKNNGANSATIGHLQATASSKTITAWITFYQGAWAAANGKDVYFSNLSFNF